MSEKLTLEQSLEDSINEFLKEKEIELQENLKFFSSDRFGDIIRQIKHLVGDEGTIGDNPYKKFVLGDVTNKEFLQVFDCLFEEKIASLKVINEPSPFQTDYVIYQDMKFLMILGQGLAFIVQGKKYKKEVK